MLTVQRQDRIKLARALREARLQKKFVQAMVAKRADMPQSVVARLESDNRRVSFDTLAKVAHALGKHIELT